VRRTVRLALEHQPGRTLFGRMLEFGDGATEFVAVAAQILLLDEP
jgi:hypothetical protein